MQPMLSAGRVCAPLREFVMLNGIAVEAVRVAREKRAWEFGVPPVEALDSVRVNPTVDAPVRDHFQVCALFPFEMELVVVAAVSAERDEEPPPEHPLRNIHAVPVYSKHPVESEGRACERRPATVTKLLPEVEASPLSSDAVNGEPPRMIPVRVLPVPEPPAATGTIS